MKRNVRQIAVAGLVLSFIVFLTGCTGIGGATPTPVPTQPVYPQSTNGLPTAEPTAGVHKYVLPCEIKGGISSNQVMTVTWLESFSYSDAQSTERLMYTAGGPKASGPAYGTFLQLNLHVSTFGDGLRCLVMRASWKGMPKNLNSIVYVYNFAAQAVPVTTPLIQNPGTLPILLNMDRCLYTIDSSVPKTPLPFGAITLSLEIDTVSGYVYRSDALHSYQFTRQI